MMIDDRPLAADPHVRERISEAHVERRGLGYMAIFPHWSVSLEVDGLRRRNGDLHAMVRVHASDWPGTLHVATVNLASTTSRATLARALTQRMDGRYPVVPWIDVVERTSAVILEAELAGPSLERVGALPARETPLHRVDPLLLLGHANGLHGDAGTGKSTLAEALAVSVETGIEIIPGLRPVMAPVLILDWEMDAQATDERVKAIAAGVGIDPPKVRYMRCADSLVHLAEHVSRIVQADGIGLVVVDSLGLALGQSREGGDANDSTLRLFEALRAIGTTSLLIDHIPKSEAATPSRPARQYGSVYKHAMTRQGFELRATTRLGEADVAHIGLYHSKHNFTRRLAPIGIRMTHMLGAIGFEREEIVEELTEGLSVPQRAALALREGPMTQADLAARIGADADNMRRQLGRATKRFLRLPDSRWALIEDREDALLH